MIRRLIALEDEGWSEEQAYGLLRSQESHLARLRALKVALKRNVPLRKKTVKIHRVKR